MAQHSTATRVHSFIVGLLTRWESNKFEKIWNLFRLDCTIWFTIWCLWYNSKINIAYFHHKNIYRTRSYSTRVFQFACCIACHTLSQLWDYIFRKRTIHCRSMLALWDLTHFQALTLGLIVINCTWFVDDYYFSILRCGTLRNPNCSNIGLNLTHPFPYEST